MNKRKYGVKTNRKPRKTTSDKLKACGTWEEVVALPLYDEWVKTCSVDYNWLEDDRVTGHSADEYFQYEELCLVIEETLAEKENKVFFAITEEEKSLRVIAKEIGCSHQTVSNIYDRSVNKLRKALKDWETN
jgi:RNA polymerase sigma factor (sigma-70 family)|tara:strand:+ start:146 stop:541 length:396 start_codon:yes stop_codon:yes gene_type:complete